MKYAGKWKNILLPVAITMIWLSAFFCIQPVSASAGQQVQLEVGRELYYGTHSTNYFTVDGRTAYCLEPLKDTPGAGSYRAESLENGSVRKGLYYMYGGPGYDEFRKIFGTLSVTGGADEEYCMSHCILSYLFSGKDTAFTGLNASRRVSLKQKAEDIRLLPDPPASFHALLFNVGASGQTMGGVGREKTGEIQIYKISDHPQWTEENPCYSLAGAQFGIFDEKGESPLWTVTTDEKGYGIQKEIPIGIYEIRELASPKGFALSGQGQKITVEEDTITRYECENNAQYCLPDLMLYKTDSETNEKVPQGEATLKDAEFEIRFYGGFYERDPAQEGQSPLRTWVLKTDEAGEVRLSDEYKVGGDEFYKTHAGQPVIPLGTVTIQERKAPQGYLRNDQVYVQTITSAGENVTDTLWYVTEISQDVIKGGLRLVKFRESDDGAEEHKQSLEGIQFTLTSQSTGERIEIVTDENGYAQTPTDEKGRGVLTYGTYLVSEKNTPDGLKPVEDFQITICKEGKILHYILENKKIFSPVSLIKKDAQTGETIPISGAEFRLLDQNGEPVEMTTYYPQETVHSTFFTDESGSFTLPEKLEAGIYYFQEVNAPQGYILKSDPVRFEIRETHDWTEPFIVEFQNTPVKGKICIEKADSETGAPLQGAQFEIRAKEDIRSLQGNVCVEAGTVVEEVLTDEQGKSCTGYLHLGKYEIRETKPPEGYALDTTVYEAELSYKDQNTPVVTQSVSCKNRPTTVVLVKSDHETGERIQGVLFSVHESIHENETEPTDKITLHTTEYETDEQGEILIAQLPPGEYVIRETASATGYCKKEVEIKVVVDENGWINGEDCAKFFVENDKTRIKDSTASWKENGEKQVPPGEGNIITDMVILENLEKGKQYTLRGILANPDTGEPIAGDKKRTSGEKTWTAQGDTQEIEMEFPLDSRLFQGEEIVVLEYLYEGETLISSHENLEDKDQTVEVRKQVPVPVPTGDMQEKKVLVGIVFTLVAVFGACLAFGYRKICRRK